MGATGRAALYFGSGNPFELTEYPVLDPGPGEVLARLDYTSICGSDVHYWRGEDPVMEDLAASGLLLGHETVGHVERLGSGITTDSAGQPLAVGDPIVFAYFRPCGRCRACTQSRANACEQVMGGLLRPPSEPPHFVGAFADYYHLRRGQYVLRLPDGMTPEHGISANCAAAQSWMGLLRGGVGPGERVVVQGAGGLGLYAVAAAKRMGAGQVVAVDVMADRLAAATALGADAGRPRHHPSRRRSPIRARRHRRGVRRRRVQPQCRTPRARSGPGRPRMTQVTDTDPTPALLVNRMVVGGELLDARSGETFEVLNPADGSVITRLPAAGAADVDHAVEVAREAQRAWARRSVATRAGLLRRWADLCEERVEGLAKIESLDVGKPIATARAVDGSMLMENMRYYAGMPDKLEGRTIPVSGRFVTMVLREPIGVVAGITPWNFALVGAAGKAVSALAAGNAIVIKPSPLASLSALALAQVALEAGIPPGLVNVVTDAASAAGEALVRHPGIGHVSFTGSDAVGRKVAAAAGGELKTCTMELGGKSPLVVFDDADIAGAAKAAFLGIFLNAGEMCTASSRLLVHRAVHDELLDAVIATAGGLRIGDPADESTVLGPVISAAHRDRIEGYVQVGRDEGGDLVTGGARPDLPGFYVTPTVFDNVEPTARIAREEIFGPVLSVMPFADEDEALRIANDATYGLGSGIFTGRIDRALRFANRIEAGNVWINAYNLLHPAVPFGGYKNSGFGREGGFSGMRHFTREKSVWFATG